MTQPLSTDISHITLKSMAIILTNPWRSYSNFAAVELVFPPQPSDSLIFVSWPCP